MYHIYTIYIKTIAYISFRPSQATSCSIFFATLSGWHLRVRQPGPQLCGPNDLFTIRICLCICLYVCKIHVWNALLYTCFLPFIWSFLFLLPHFVGSHKWENIWLRFCIFLYHNECDSRFLRQISDWLI